MKTTANLPPLCTHIRAALRTINLHFGLGNRGSLNSRCSRWFSLRHGGKKDEVKERRTIEIRILQRQVDLHVSLRFHKI